ncbi:MAG: TGS domain-containing protein [Anaerolineales bacterium]|nr:TGS domain-containing protein [Anaerolineales bacterium]
MPTNLPPEYFAVDKRYRAATTTEEKIETLEELLGTIPKHKGTDHLRSDLRRKLSKLKDSKQKGKAASRQVSVFSIKKEGAGQAVVIGPANAGKSSLVAALTNAQPEVAEYPFSTWNPTPGMMPIENVQVQLIDTPPLNRDFIEPDLIDMIRRADLALLAIDIQAAPFDQLEETVAFLESHRIIPMHRKDDFPQDRRHTFFPFLVVVNKVDDENLEDDYKVFKELLDDVWHTVPISAATGHNVEQFKWTVFDLLEITRIYSQAPGKAPDLNSPFVMQRGSTIEEFAAQVHQEIASDLKTARVWGSADFDGQMVGRDFVLQDGDVVELRA